jgi:hypothetical protein
MRAYQRPRHTQAMDPAGARALARRLAEGKPDADAHLDVPLLPAPTPPAEPDDVVYLKPSVLRPARQVWVYVRELDGRLRRAR